MTAQKVITVGLGVEVLRTQHLTACSRRVLPGYASAALALGPNAAQRHRAATRILHPGPGPALTWNPYLPCSIKTLNLMDSFHLTVFVHGHMLQ